MNSDYKLFVWLAVIFFIAPIIGLGISEYQKANCRLELGKLGRTVEDIERLCK